MTASELLRDLREDYEGPYLDPLRNVLPLIADVVREVERQISEAHEDDVDLELAAALTALRDALQPEGDRT